MSFTIRPFSTGEYPVLISIHNAVYPNHPWIEEEIRTWDMNRNPEHLFGRWVLEVAHGQVVAYAYYYQPPHMYDPRALSFNIKVHPSYQRQGFGSALYSQLATQFDQLQITTVRTLVSSDNEAGIQFLAQRHFEEEMRAWESWLDVAAFDPTPYAHLETHLHAVGIEIRSYEELSGDPTLARRFNVLYNELFRDVPQPEPYTDMTFEEFEREVLGNPAFLPDALFLALHHGELIGMAQLGIQRASGDLLTGLTGVKRSYRRQGVARALKVRTIAYAQAHGYGTIKTANASTNQAMLAINYALGFSRQPSWIHFCRRLRES
jgi:RimJ/RimL family protein N-acetyltransferase